MIWWFGGTPIFGNTQILFWNPIWGEGSQKEYGTEMTNMMVGKLNKKEPGITSTGNVGKVSEQHNHIFFWRVTVLLKQTNHVAFKAKGRLTWNIIMEVWKTIFLYKRVTLRFQPLIFRGVILKILMTHGPKSPDSTMFHWKNTGKPWVAYQRAQLFHRSGLKYRSKLKRALWF